MSPNLFLLALTGDFRGLSARRSTQGTAPKAPARLGPALDIALGRGVVGRHVDLDELKVFGLSNHVVGHAAGLAETRPGNDGHRFVHSVEPELDPAGWLKCCHAWLPGNSSLYWVRDFSSALQSFMAAMTLSRSS
jgi:hypothetical protein